jgi:asparagine synthase (glutamine-hydrolysing)
MITNSCRNASDLLHAAVADRMVADVPIGLFLSGGIDSSTVVALMQSQSSRPVRTYTIGFGERGFDEAANAAAVARHLGTSHTELRLTPAEARAVIPELPTIWDEPFADESQIPTLLLSRLARQEVTVLYPAMAATNASPDIPGIFCPPVWLLS